MPDTTDLAALARAKLVDTLHICFGDVLEPGAANEIADAVLEAASARVEADNRARVAALIAELQDNPAAHQIGGRGFFIPLADSDGEDRPEPIFPYKRDANDVKPTEPDHPKVNVVVVRSEREAADFIQNTPEGEAAITRVLERLGCRPEQKSKPDPAPTPSLPVLKVQVLSGMPEVREGNATYVPLSGLRLRGDQ